MPAPAASTRGEGRATGTLAPWTGATTASAALGPAPRQPAAVYAALERAEDYPRWWPQVREVRRIDDASGVVRIRSLLPYDLTFTAARGAPRPGGRGPGDRACRGDLEGWARWTLTARGTGTRARYDQEVDVHQAAAAAARRARPARLPRQPRADDARRAARAEPPT